MAEFLPGFEASFWTGVGAPKNTPSEIITKLNKEINVAISDLVMKSRFADLGSSVFPPGSPAEFGQFIGEETQKWGNVVKAAGRRSEPALAAQIFHNHSVNPVCGLYPVWVMC
jgi:tripartite-type tricarboxylate transporter receptor subunit TctC